MNKFKKIGLFVILFGALFMFSGCGSKHVEGTLEEIMDKVYKNVPEDHRPMMLENGKITAENVEMFLGSKEIEYEEAIASESMTGSVAHSVMLVRTKKGADVEKVKEQIKTAINEKNIYRKWICVGIEPDEVVIKNKDDLIMILIVEDTDNRANLEKGFDEL